MANRLYATDEAGQNWFLLLQELQRLAWDGHVELHVTTKGRKRREDGDKEYPPVYKIVFEPLRWESISEDQITLLYGIAAKHEAKVNLRGRASERGLSAHFIAVFESR